VRVIDLSYREFVSKNGRHIQLLTLEMIDFEGCTIEGCLFGQQATNQRDTLRQGNIYKVSRAKVEEDTYLKHSRPHNHSNLTLKFGPDARFLPHADVPAIPYCSKNLVRLKQAQNKVCLEKVFNFVAVLLEIEPERTISK
jgi:hypothetical protein